jgi:protein arginine phosphatase
MAEYLLRHFLQKQKLSFAVKVVSAGLNVYGGGQMTSTVSDLLGEEAIEHDPKRCAVAVDDLLVEDADLILTMTAEQLRQICQRFPSAAEKTFLLNEYSGIGREDIEDPYGKGLENYRRVLEDIRLALKNLMIKIVSS